jgi:hypothetical protein
LLIHSLDSFAGFARWIRSLDSLAAFHGFARCSRWILSLLSLDSLAEESIGTMRNRDDSTVDDLHMENMELSGGMIIYSIR